MPCTHVSPSTDPSANPLPPSFFPSTFCGGIKGKLLLKCKFFSCDIKATCHKQRHSIYLAGKVAARWMCCITTWCMYSFQTGEGYSALKGITILK
ncbi:hypothetical protein XELAEV_18046453mg [Xenopus laevis]|uniref:Uncharacterized protein n=1 Tax=Xenopus laevis TaxID=8355 RepID=A0A974BTB1_XENLA|nr:hypothetical protein XELAEV_18046453mg [Xenopus laevis]